MRLAIAGSFLAVLLALPAVGRSQEPPPAAAPADKADVEPEADAGIPIQDDVVQRACGACHARDDKGRMSRISFRRTTPEGWQFTVRRMISLNGVALEPDEARHIVRYLSDTLGLAPEEARSGQFEVERRNVDYKYTADADTETTCNRCHSFGRVILQRRTKREWELLVAMHRGYYPLSDFQAFRRMGPPSTDPGPDGRPPDNRHPMEKAIAHLSGAFPMKSPEWAAWSATLTEPRLEGRWALTGHDPGRGPVFGEVTIRRPDEGADRGLLLTDIRYVYPRTGQVVARTGRVVVYTGFQWRGRSEAGSGGPDEMREVMVVERNRRLVTGRWFKGAYDEFGLDVRLERLGGDPHVTGVDRASLKSGTDRAEVRVFGANLPTALAPGDISLGPGVEVLAVRDQNASGFTLDLAVVGDARVGRRDLVVAGIVKEQALLVYDRVQSLKVRPQAGLARVGGINFPKQYQQFEAVAYHHGPDGKPDTADDLEIGVVDATWALEEYTATFDDDDLQFVGTLSRDGLFTPNVDGPNPKRRNNTNNYGDVWVVATHTPPGEKALRARAHLLVTVPVYIRYDRLEGSK